MSFVLLVLALLGGGLICLLVINTTLGASSFRITQLQSTNASLSEQDQALQQAIATEEAPGQIARRAYALGMRGQSQLNYLDPVTGRIYRVGARGPGTVEPFVPARERGGRRGQAGKKVAAGTRGARSARKTHGPKTHARTTRAPKTHAHSRHGGTRQPRTKARAGSA